LLLHLVVLGAYRKPVDVYWYGHDDFGTGTVLITGMAAGREASFDPLPFRSPVLKPDLHLEKIAKVIFDQRYNNTAVYKLFHHQPINVPTAGAQASLMDYT
jgi:hypothetical protein